MLFGRSLSIPVPGLIFSLLGLGWCIFMSLGIGTELVCITSGCQVVENVRIFGISPWWAAVALFGLMSLIALLRLRALASLVALFFLLGDCLFLLVMLFLAPCTNCLILALILFCAWISLRSKFTTLVVPRRIFAGVMGGLWLLLFLLNLGPVLNEIIAPRQLLSHPNSSVSVYISPSCPACIQAVRAFDKAATFYAVAEDEADLAMIADLEARLAAGQGLAAALDEITEQRLAGAYKAPQLSFWQGLSLRFASMRNQARLSRLGYNAVPVIMFEGLPAHWARPRSASPALPPAQPSGQPSTQAPRETVPPIQAMPAPTAPPAPRASGEPAPVEPAPVDPVVPVPAEPMPLEPAPAEPLPAPPQIPAIETPGASAYDGAIIPMLPDLPAELLEPTLDCGPDRAVPCDPAE